MNKKEEKVPHVVSREQGAHDVPVKHADDESAGHHSGRKHPKPEKAGGFDYAQGAANGGVLEQ